MFFQDREFENKKHKEYFEAEHYLNQGLIRTTVPQEQKKLTRREWMLKFLDDLNHPENKFPSIHIAGTSGKSSTAVLIAEILRAAGYRVGLHTTPYLQLAVEKYWVDGKYIEPDEFVDLIEWIKPICEKWRGPKVPLHGMASFGICLEYFRRKKIDIAVIETGVGGRDDITNVIHPCLSVITPIGFDHEKTLGETIESISGHKAGIIKPKVPVVAYKGYGKDVILSEADKKNSSVHWVEENNSSFIVPKVMKGKFQYINTSLAKSAAEVLKKQGYSLNDSNIKKGINRAKIPGRFEMLQNNPVVVIDGAHNYQKLSRLFEEMKEKNWILIFGMLKSKINEDVLNLLKNKSSEIVFTKPVVYGKEALNPKIIRSYFSKKKISCIPLPSKALQTVLKSAKSEDTVVVTGSLYLAGNIRDLYFPSEKILESGTSWPL